MTTAEKFKRGQEVIFTGTCKTCSSAELQAGSVVRIYTIEKDDHGKYYVTLEGDVFCDDDCRPMHHDEG